MTSTVARQRQLEGHSYGIGASPWERRAYKRPSSGPTFFQSPHFQRQTGEDIEGRQLNLRPRQLTLFDYPFSAILNNHEGTRRTVHCFSGTVSSCYLMDEASTLR